MYVSDLLRSLLATLVLLCAIGAKTVSAQVYINEMFFDPGGNSDVEERDEYIELRGTPGMSLADHYLLIIESEDNIDSTGEAGFIENIFDFGIADSGSATSLGANGYLVIRQAGNQLTGPGASGPSPYTPAPGATDLVNTGSGPGYGSGATSSIGASDLGGEGVLENGGFTAMLIRNVSGPAPVLGEDLDVGNDGLDNPNGREGWEILDAITYFEEREAVNGQAYAPIVFGVEPIGQLILTDDGPQQVNPGLEPGATYVDLGYEIELLARWGNSTGQGEEDWHITNLTDNTGSGSIPLAQLPAGSPIDYRQSYVGDHDLGFMASGAPNQPPVEELESNKSVPYGTRLLTNIGAPNYITGDYSGDGVVDSIDYAVWRESLGQTGTQQSHPAADHNHDFVVDGLDFASWLASFGAPGSSALPGSSIATPEPGSLVLSLGLGVLLAQRRSSSRTAGKN